MATTTTTTAAPCTYNAITLQVGQSFVIPPGGVIIGASDIDLLSSADNCADLTNLEEAECYGFFFSESISDGGDAAYNDIEVQGIIVNGVTYPFSSSITPPNFPSSGSIPTSFLDSLQERLSELSIGGLFFNFSGWGQSTPSSGDASNTVMVCFTTFPSIAEEMYIYGLGTNDSIAAPVPVLFPVTTPDIMYNNLSIVANFTGKCTCQTA
jgi:hypothetical protein